MPNIVIDLIGSRPDGQPSIQRLRQASRTAERLGVDLPRACATSWKTCLVFTEQSQCGHAPHMPTFGLLSTIERELAYDLRQAERFKTEAVKLLMLATARNNGVWVG